MQSAGGWPGPKTSYPAAGACAEERGGGTADGDRQQKESLFLSYKRARCADLVPAAVKE